MRSVISHKVPDNFIITKESYEASRPRLVIEGFCRPPPICAVLNSSIHQNYVRPKWKQADVISLTKVTPVSKLEKDPRPIALTPKLARMHEGFRVNRMREKACHSST